VLQGFYFNHLYVCVYSLEIENRSSTTIYCHIILALKITLLLLAIYPVKNVLLSIHYTSASLCSPPYQINPRNQKTKEGNYCSNKRNSADQHHKLLAALNHLY